MDHISEMMILTNKWLLTQLTGYLWSISQEWSSLFFFVCFCVFLFGLSKEHPCLSRYLRINLFIKLILQSYLSPISLYVRPSTLHRRKISSMVKPFLCLDIFVFLLFWRPSLYLALIVALILSLVS